MSLMLKKYKLYLGIFLLAFILLNAILFITGFALFGNKSLAIMDASIQYLDFFPTGKMSCWGKIVRLLLLVIY